MRKIIVRSGTTAIVVVFCIGLITVLVQLKNVGMKDISSSRTLQESLIFIGGVPRSGTTLMRAILDAHPDIRCGEETRIIPRILDMHKGLRPVEKERLELAHINEAVLKHALGAYILTVITEHGSAARRLCNKDPFTMKHIPTLYEVFPKAKFILMIRDGRATAHSIVSRKVTIAGFDFLSYEGSLKDWNRSITIMFSHCLAVGSQICYMMRYEELVLSPREKIKSLLDWLNIPWDEAVLHHEDFIGKEVAVSNREASTSQVNRSINAEALTSWIKSFPVLGVEKLDEIAPMLRHLGYDPSAVEPNYANLKEIKQVAVEMPPDLGRNVVVRD